MNNSQASLLIAGLVLSTIAGILSAIAFIPQTIKSLITRSTAGLSILLTILGMSASIVWVAWGSLNAAFTPAINNATIALGQGTIESLQPLGPSISAAQTAAPVWTNALVIIWTGLLLMSKIFNILSAKKLGLNESQYCNLKAKESYERHRNSSSLISKFITRLTRSSIDTEDGGK